MKTTGHQQSSLFKTHWKHSLNYGGILRRKKLGRSLRPLSTKEPIHLVLKTQRCTLRTGTLRSPYGRAIIDIIIKKYAQRFFVKIDQYSIQGDHIHFLIRAPRRSRYQYFFRVIAGQIAQQFLASGLLKAMTGAPLNHKIAAKDQGEPGFRNGESSTGLWMYRPFTRVVRGYRAYRIVRDYIQLNECEAKGVIRYRKNRLRGLSLADWQILWR
jgi:REP element-mobilizing transposase RayT